jgi:hypothetical protein
VLRGIGAYMGSGQPTDNGFRKEVKK